MEKRAQKEDCCKKHKVEQSKSKVEDAKKFTREITQNFFEVLEIFIKYELSFFGVILKLSEALKFQNYKT